MAERKFKPGDLVRSIGTGGPYEQLIKGKIGVFKRYWDPRYQLRGACDVEYFGVTDLYGRPDIAQTDDNLELVEGFRPSETDPFDWIVNGQKVRVRPEWKSCKRTGARGQVRCPRCYPETGREYQSHGPYYYAYWQENGKQRRKYLGKTLPPLEQRLA